VAALFDHGLKTASPRLLLDLMPSPGELTTEHVKSHLQKYRLHRDKSREDFLHRFAQQLDQGFEKDDSTVQRVCCEDAGFSCRNLPLVHSIAPMKIPQLVCASESDCVDQHRNVLQQLLALISEGIAMQTSFQQQLAQLVNCQLSSHQSLQDHSNLLTSSSSSSGGGVSGVHHNPPASPTPSDGSLTQPVSSRCCSSNSTTSSTAAAAAAADGTFALTAAAAATADVKPTANERCYDNGNAKNQCNGTGVTGPSLSRLQEHRPREVQYEPGAYIRINNTSGSASSNDSSAVSASFGVVPLTGTAASHAVRSISSTASQHARSSSSSDAGTAVDDRRNDRMQCGNDDVTLNVSAIGMISKIAQAQQQQYSSNNSGHHSSTDRYCGVNSSSTSSNSNSNSKGVTALAPASAGNSALHAHSGATDRLHAQMCAQMDLVSGGINC
jgi:SHAQKYF class myb-like DNA-binding protein